jgi:hypothetical protein
MVASIAQLDAIIDKFSITPEPAHLEPIALNEIDCAIDAVAEYPDMNVTVAHSDLASAGRPGRICHG